MFGVSGDEFRQDFFQLLNRPAAVADAVFMPGIHFRKCQP